MKPVGFKAPQRAMLEAERRFCGNKTEEVDDSNVSLNNRKMMAMLLKLRTLPCNNVESGVRKEAVRLLKLAYVEFGVNCVLYDRKQVAYAKLATSTQPKQATTYVTQQENAVLRLKAAHGITLSRCIRNLL